MPSVGINVRSAISRSSSANRLEPIQEVGIHGQRVDLVAARCFTLHRAPTFGSSRRALPLAIARWSSDDRPSKDSRLAIAGATVAGGMNGKSKPSSNWLTGISRSIADRAPWWVDAVRSK